MTPRRCAPRGAGGYCHTHTAAHLLQLQGCCQLADTAFKQSHFDVAFALVRAGEISAYHVVDAIVCAHAAAVQCAGVHKHGMSNDKLCKRYLFNLEMIVKGKAAANKKIEGPPRMLYLRELYASIHQIFKEQVLAVVCLARRLLPPTAAPAAHPPTTPTDARALLPIHSSPGITHHHARETEFGARTHVVAAGPLPTHSASHPLRFPPRSTHQSAHDETHTSCAQSPHPPARAAPTNCTGTARETPHAHIHAQQRFPNGTGLSTRRRAQAGPEALLAGDKCVLMKERGVMVVGLSLQEWRVLLEKNTGSDKMQMISGVEEAVMRGLSQSEGTSDSQTDLKASWNSWALRLCEMEGGSPQLRSKCLLQRTVLLLQQQMHHKALESATEVLKLYPDSKHASALLATSQHKAGKKKESAVTVSELVVAFQRAEDTNMLSDELGCAPALVTVRRLRVRAVGPFCAPRLAHPSTCAPSGTLSS